MIDFKPCQQPVVLRHSVLILMVLAGGVSCSPSQFPTMTLYDTPNTFVRLEADRTVESGHGHSHPATLSSDQMAAVLAGIVVEAPATRMPLYDDTSQPRRHPAFTGKDILLFAPLLARALSEATPEEIVTFYQTRNISMGRREVTSGGLYVVGEELHFFLSNYRSKTHTGVDPGVADTTDDRMTPLQSLAPQPGKLFFEPAEFSRSSVSEGFARLFYFDRRELIILFRNLQPKPLSNFQTPASPSATR